MIPISAVVGVSTVGYLLDQFIREKEFRDENENSDIPVSNRNMNQCANQFNWNFIENFDDLPINNKKQSNFQENFGNINTSGNGNSSGNGNNQTDFDSIFLNNKPIISPNVIQAEENFSGADYLLNATQRPVEDFLVNNTVPFFRGSGTNQNMAGTGVKTANVDWDRVDMGYNHRTPHNTLLSTFSGCDDTYRHKREAPNMFSPAERRTKETIPGARADAQRPLRDRYTTSILTKNDQQPFEKIQVGPGIFVNSDMPNDGQGFNSGLTTNVRPNNVNEYRIHTFEGRISGEKYQYSNLPTANIGTGPSFKSELNTRNNKNAIDRHLIAANKELMTEMNLTENFENENNFGNEIYGLPQKKPSLSVELNQERRPMTATTGGVINAPMHYSNPVLPSGTNKRVGTNVEFGQSIPLS